MADIIINIINILNLGIYIPKGVKNINKIQKKSKNVMIMIMIIIIIFVTKTTTLLCSKQTL